jgi:predicted PurR-regulated permease PerM
VIVLTATSLFSLPNFICIVYLIVALILTLIGNPVLDFFTRRLKFNHIFATIATLFIFVIVISGFIMMFIPLILSQGQNLSLLNTGAIEQQTIQLVNQISVFLENHIDSSKY